MSLNGEVKTRRGAPRLVRTAVEAGSEAEVFALLAKRLAVAIDDKKTLTRDLPPLTSRFVEVYDRYQRARASEDAGQDKQEASSPGLSVVAGFDAKAI